VTCALTGWILENKLAVVAIALFVFIFVTQLLRAKAELRRAARESLADDPFIWVLIVLLTLVLLFRAADGGVSEVLLRTRLAVFIIGALVILFLGWLLGDKSEPPPEEEPGEPPTGGLA